MSGATRFKHFDAIRMGLTATPAAHTVALFGEPVFRYGVEQAIRDGWLVDYDPVVISSQVKMNGVFLKEGEQVGKVDTQTGIEALDQIEDERHHRAGLQPQAHSGDRQARLRARGACSAARRTRYSSITARLPRPTTRSSQTS
jgi:type I site-specific restriction endonuclease